MDTDDYKKYNILENILQKVNQKYIALPEAEKKRNNKLLEVIDRIIQNLKNKSVLFKNLYEEKFYGGSYYDGLKVEQPSEYDLDCLLTLPKIVQPTVEISDKPGYVHILLKNMKALEKKLDEAPKYVGLEKLLDGDRLSTKKVKSWIESLMTSAVTPNMIVEIDIGEETKCVVKVKLSKSGPAQTIKLDFEMEEKKFNIDIDLVPCFKFFEADWPKGDYRRNPSTKKTTFFVVPKSPSDDEAAYWRLSFQAQERELINDYSVMKPTIRLIKKIRDRHQHAIASYYIKTVFLWEVDRLHKNFWSKPLSFVFAKMLRKYSEYIEKKNIPYYWNDKNNLIGDLSDATVSNVSNKIRNIADHIDRICNSKSDIFGVIPYLLKSDEIDLQKFQQEVPLSKKLKRLERTKLESQPIAIVSTPESGSDTSSCSSFEIIPETTTVKATESGTTSNSEISKLLSKLETMCLSLTSEQKRIFGMMETAIDKIENCERQIEKLAARFEKQKTEYVDKVQELETIVSGVDKKIDNLLEKNKPCSTNLALDDLLGLGDNLRSTLNFQSQ